MQRTDSAWQSLSATQTRMVETQAAFSASAGKTINTGSLLAVTTRADLELMAMTPGMNRLHGELHRGVDDIDNLRIAANADVTGLMRSSEKGDTQAQSAVMNVLGVVANSNQYNAQDARLAMSILEQRTQTAGELGMTNNEPPRHTTSVNGGAGAGSALPGKTGSLINGVAHEATLYRNGYASGVDAGQRRLDENVDTGRLDTGFSPNESLKSKDTFGAETARLAAGSASDRAALDRAAKEVQRDLRDQGVQVVDDVSHLDVNKGTLENTRSVLTGEAADIILNPLGQDKTKALEDALSSLEKR